MVVDTLRTDLTEALRAGEALRVGTLRMALTALSEAEVAGKARRTLSDEEALKVLAKEAKKRRESAQVYRDAERPDRAVTEDAEAEVLEAYLPQQLGPDELAAVVDEVFAAEGFSQRAQ